MSHPVLLSYKPDTKPCNKCGSKDGYSIHSRCLNCGLRYGLKIIEQVKDIFEGINIDKFMRERPHPKRGKGW